MKNWKISIRDWGNGYCEWMAEETIVHKLDDGPPKYMRVVFANSLEELFTKVKEEANR